MNIKLIYAISALLFLITSQKPKLIAHRGGIVDTTNAENGLKALQDAYSKGYYMVEIDVRLTKDGKLITNHDEHFRKYYNNPATVSSLPWDSIKVFHNNRDGGQPLLFEDVLKYCKGKLQLMVDNKIKGPDTTSFREIERLLRKYKLLDKAMFIGTIETRNYFLHKALCGFSRPELEKMMTANADMSKLFLFDHGNVLQQSDINWANEHKLPVVPSINKFHYTKEPMMVGAKRDIHNLRSWGVEYYQIDSEFDSFFE